MQRPVEQSLKWCGVKDQASTAILNFIFSRLNRMSISDSFGIVFCHLMRMHMKKAGVVSNGDSICIFLYVKFQCTPSILTT